MDTTPDTREPLSDDVHEVALALNRTFDIAFADLPMGAAVIHRHATRGPIEATIVGRYFGTYAGFMLPMVELDCRRGPKYVPAMDVTPDTRNPTREV